LPVPVYQAQNRELLEDAIIIYRVQRAPERQVFYIDVGKMPQCVLRLTLRNQGQNQAEEESTYNGEQQEVDSVYNPQSMSEDFFFASRPDGKGSRS
jgi:hypothetical protein